MLDSKVTYEEGVEIPVKVKPKNKEKHMIVPTEKHSIFKEERFWATLAHAMGPIMIGLFFFGEGAGGWFGLLLVSGGIYLYFSEKSPYIKHHARQAFAIQLFGTIGWFAAFMGLIFVGLPLWFLFIIISAVLIVVFVGLILLPLAIMSWPLLLMASFVMPLSTAILGAMGAWETWHGREFNYPRLSEWLDRKFGVAYKLV